MVVLGCRIPEGARKAGSISFAQPGRCIFDPIRLLKLCETNIMPVARAVQGVETATHPCEWLILAPAFHSEFENPCNVALEGRGNAQF